MRKNAGLMIITLLLLVVPALANAWTLAVKVAGGSTANNVKVVYGATTKVLKNGTSYLYPTGTATITFEGAAPTASTLDGVANAGPITLSSGSHTVAASYAAAALTGFNITQAAGGAIYAQNMNNTWTTTGVSGVAPGTILPVTIAADANHKIVSYDLGAGVVNYNGTVAGQVLALSAAANGQAITATYGVAGKVTANLFAPTNGTTTKAINCSVAATSNDTGLQYAFAVTGPAAFSQAASATQTFSFTPALAGSYTVTATVTSANGGSATASASVNVADFLTATNTGCVSCHSTSTPAVITGYNSGTHGNSTITCQGCHDSAKSHGSAKSGISLTSTTAADIYEPGQSTAGVPKADGYAGAAACSSCHAETFAKWSKTSHNKPLKSLAAQGASIFKNDNNNNGANDFVDGLNLKTSSIFKTYTTATRGGELALAVENGKYYMKIGKVKYEVIRTQGGNGKWKQRYQTKIGNAYYLLPLQYNEIDRSYEAYNTTNWFSAATTPNTLLIDGNPGDTNLSDNIKAEVQRRLVTRNQASNGPSAGSWDNRCASCHQTGVSIEFKVGPDSVNAEVIASSADLNIGCESCHGPGAAHVAGPTAANIKNPSNWATNAGSLNYYRANEVCGQCHSRTEGFAHFSSSMYGKVVKGIEAPSQDLLIGSEPIKGKSYTIGERILDYIEKNIPTVFLANGTTSAVSGNESTNNGHLAYDDGNRMTVYTAGSGHHQQWHDIELGAHGATQQMTKNQGLTCFSCHDAHNPNSSNIKSSITKNGVSIATASEDNTLCLACHAGQGDFTAATVNDVANAPQGDAVKNAVYNHMTVKGADGKGCVGVTPESWKAKYLKSEQRNGNSATFGIAVYKVGQCISCHMPFTAKSGIYTSTNANGRKQGDQRAHSMKAVWPKLSGNGLAATGTGPTVVTSCSACHTVPN